MPTGLQLMTAPKSKVIQTLEGLSTVIIETLKELSANRQPLTLDFLTDALAKRDEIKGLIPSSNGKHGASHPEGRGKKPPNGDPAIQPARTYEADLRQTVEEQELAARLTAVWRRSILTLLSVTDIPAAGPVAQAAGNFKRVVTADSEPVEIEEALSALRNAMMHEEVSGNDAGDSGESRNSQPARQSRGAGEADLTAYLIRLRELYVSVFSEFNLDLGEEYVGQLFRVQKKIGQCSSIDQLVALEGEIVDLVQTFNKILIEERLKVTDIITEIGSGLIEMENQFMSSMNHTARTASANTTFNNMLDLHMEDLKKSAHLSTTLTDFRSMVFSRLASIKEALESKRKDDALRRDTIDSEMQQLQSSLQKMKVEIEQAQEKRMALEREVLIDPLTGISNRRGYKRRFREELQRFHRYQHIFSILLLDIDHFKQVNDKHGHWAGDKCIKELIKRIKPMMRISDHLARYGGEEFSALLPGTDAESARLVAERVCRAVANTRFVYQNQEIRLTVSIGVTQVREGDQTQETVFKRVDGALYQAKETGRNRVVMV